jgi:hypothetical protein
MASRQQLYFMGEPLGDCVTQPKLGGGYWCGGGGGGSKGPSPEHQARANAEERARRVSAATQQVDSIFAPQFTDDWYNQNKTAYSNYYVPELQRQYERAQQQLTMNLAQVNPYGSSANNQQFADLQRAYNDQYGNMLQSADQFASDLRTRVGDARGKALLNAGDSDLNTILSQAKNQAAAASAVPAFSPLADVFSKFVQPAAMGMLAQQSNAPAAAAATAAPADGVNNFNARNRSLG